MSNNQDESDEESSRKRLTVPSGFRNLLENLTLEILRSNPSDIYKFAAEYFKSRLQERQGRRIVQYCCYICNRSCRLRMKSRSFEVQEKRLDFREVFINNTVTQTCVTRRCSHFQKQHSIWFCFLPSFSTTCIETRFRICPLSFWKSIAQFLKSFQTWKVLSVFTSVVHSAAPLTIFKGLSRVIGFVYVFLRVTKYFEAKSGIWSPCQSL